MKEDEVSLVARLIASTLKDDSEQNKTRVRAEVGELTSRFRPYPDVV
jgi:glycine/serine hydroxymethyltransferase